jgi:hypothetical protein
MPAFARIETGDRTSNFILLHILVSGQTMSKARIADPLRIPEAISYGVGGCAFCTPGPKVLRVSVDNGELQLHIEKSPNLDPCEHLLVYTCRLHDHVRTLDWIELEHRLWNQYDPEKLRFNYLNSLRFREIHPALIPAVDYDIVEFTTTIREPRNEPEHVILDARMVFSPDPEKFIRMAMELAQRGGSAAATM